MNRLKLWAKRITLTLPALAICLLVAAFYLIGEVCNFLGRMSLGTGETLAVFCTGFFSSIMEDIPGGGK